MITYKDSVFNSWNDVVKKFPAMWVVFGDIILKHGKVLSGNIIAILPDEEVIEFRHKNHGRVKLSLRTTETVSFNVNSENTMHNCEPTIAGGGYIHGELIDA